MNNDELINLINRSYLKKENKDSLIEQLKLKGETEIFYTNFNKLLIEEFDIKAKKCRQGIKEFNQRVVELDNELKKKQTNLETRLANYLSNVDIIETKKRSQIWDEYYTELENLGKDYENKLKSIIDKITIQSLDD